MICVYHIFGLKFCKHSNKPQYFERIITSIVVSLE